MLFFDTQSDTIFVKKTTNQFNEIIGILFRSIYTIYIHYIIRTVYEARAEICQKFGWLFGRFEDTKILF